jgi:BirA family biotin operon repressor/biotin-[acetyl-CoA-carboxylase] ligase
MKMNDFSFRLQREEGISSLFFKSIPSTVLYVRDCLAKGEKVPTLVFAEEQTNGQGRVGKSFFSPKGTGLYLTFTIPKNDYEADYITPRLSLAVSHAVEEVFSCSLGVKWVNDIYLLDRKVAGILCQSVSDYYLFSVGLNVERPSQIPAELSDRFGSLCDHCDSECYYKLILALFRNIKAVRFVPTLEILYEYRLRCNHIGKKISILSDGEECVGICSGISDDFSLLLSQNGKERFFSSGVMTIL